MKRKYYSQRINRGEDSISLESIKDIFSAIYKEFYNKKYFCEKLNIGCCVDSADADLSDILLKKARKNLWPIVGLTSKLQSYSKNDLFDIIEFLFDHISKPIQTADLHYHSWGDCGYHYNYFSKKEGQKEFRKEINDFLLDFEDGYELSNKGEIFHKTKKSLERLLRAEKIDFKKGDIKKRMELAENLFCRGKSSLSDRKNAVKELADCLEFLRDDLKSVLNKKDEADLFNIINNFSIRHHNKNQKTDYNQNVWLNWMFHFYSATLHASLRLINGK